MIALKKRVAVDGGVLVFMLVLTAIVGGMLYTALSSSRDNKNKLAVETRNVSSRISSAKQENQQIVESLDLWNGLAVEERAFQGLRFSDAKTALDTMIEDYWLADMRTIFSKPIETPQEDYEEYDIVSSNVSISFFGISDAMIYAFLDGLNEDFPGAVVLKKFSIDKKGEMERDTIKQIAAGERPKLFSADIEFEWRDIKKRDVKE